MKCQSQFELKFDEVELDMIYWSVSVLTQYLQVKVNGINKEKFEDIMIDLFNMATRAFVDWSSDCAAKSFPVNEIEAKFIHSYGIFSKNMFKLKNISYVSIKNEMMNENELKNRINKMKLDFEFKSNKIEIMEAMINSNYFLLAYLCFSLDQQQIIH